MKIPDWVTQQWVAREVQARADYRQWKEHSDIIALMCSERDYVEQTMTRFPPLTWSDCATGGTV